VDLYSAYCLKKPLMRTNSISGQYP